MQGDTARSRRAADDAAAFGPSPLTDIAQGFADLGTTALRRRRPRFAAPCSETARIPRRCWGLASRRFAVAIWPQARCSCRTPPCRSRQLAPTLLPRQGAFRRARWQAPPSNMRSPRIWIPPTRRRWFYDAIRLQLANQPVSALRELEQSIALNDNRAPFRSRLLLTGIRLRAVPALPRSTRIWASRSSASTRPDGR